MMKFDNAKYRTVLNLIKKTGEFKGKAVPSKARLHEMIGDALGISHNTVKDWERATSNGPDPRIPGLLEQLEAYQEPASLYSNTELYGRRAFKLYSRSSIYRNGRAYIQEEQD